MSYQISVDLEVFKALTALIGAEGQTHNDVLRDLLLVDSPLEPDAHPNPFSTASEALERGFHHGDFYSRGLVLPNGTELRARYKGKEYRAIIEEAKLRTHDNVEHDSPSAAATHITGTTVNGLRFWEGKRPTDSGWRRLDVIRDSSRR